MSEYEQGESCVREFLATLEQQNYHKRYRKDYRCFLSQFIQEVGIQYTGPDSVERLKTWLAGRAHPVARVRALGYVRAFMKWLAREQGWEDWTRRVSRKEVCAVNYVPRPRRERQPDPVPECAGEAWRSFEADCRLRQLSPLTVASYRETVCRFYSHFPFPGNKEGLAEFLDQFPNDRTKHRHFRNLKRFVRYATQEGLCPVDWISRIRPRFAKAAPEPVLSLEEVRRIMDAAPETVTGRRDRCLVALLAYTGLRRGAALNLTWPEINFENRFAHIRTKGRKEMYVPLPGPLLEELKRWRPYCPSERWVIPAIKNPDKHLDGTHALHRLKDLALKAGITRRVLAHLLRHSFATTLVENDVSIDVVSRLLGHSQLSTTMVYARYSPARGQRAVDQVFGSSSKG